MNESTLPVAEEIMTREVLSFTPDMDIAEAVARLLERGHSGAPVIDGEGRLVGVLSERDCMRVLAAAAFHGAPSAAVGDHMTREVVSVPPQADLFRLVFAFHGDAHRRVLVTDPGGRLLGLISRRDVLRALDRLRRARERQPRASTYDLIAAQHARDLAE